MYVLYIQVLTMHRLTTIVIYVCTSKDQHYISVTFNRNVRIKLVYYNAIVLEQIIREGGGGG